MASVSRQWRTVATPLFYRTIIIDIDETGFKTRARASGGNRGVRTNLGLFLGTDFVNVVRDMQIVVKGQVQTAHQLTRVLRRTGLGGTVWHGIERLRIDISGCELGISFGRRENGQQARNALSELLSLALPSLREIVLLGVGGRIHNTTAPIYKLIAERLYGPKSLRSLRIIPGILPEHWLISDWHRQAILPINIGHLHIDTRDRGPPLRLPPVLASSLVELSLNHVTASRIWNPFVADDGQSTLDGSLVFSRLRSLSLGFHDSNGNPTLDEMLLVVGAGGNLAIGDANREIDDDTTLYLSSTKFGTPLFPSLTRLEIRHFPKDLHLFLSLFAASPISKLAIHVSMDTITHEWSLSRFVKLRSLTVGITDRLSLSDQGFALDCLSILFYSISSNVQALNLEMSVCKGFVFDNLSTEIFEDNLVSLTLKCDIDPEELYVLLGSFSSLRRLTLHSVITDPIFYTSTILSALGSSDIAMMPACESLQFLHADGLRYYDDDPFDPTSESNEANTLSFEIALYRGLLYDLVCNLPSLTTLQVRATSLEGVKECIQELVDSNVAPGFLGHFRNIKLQAIDN
ncbi:hypothetical protein GGH93_000240 [Coemansia aciculifera]|nr:hypothetical protein GGH93_000240 [Coemansia aciculifera]